MARAAVRGASSCADPSFCRLLSVPTEPQIGGIQALEHPGVHAAGRAYTVRRSLQCCTHAGAAAQTRPAVAFRIFAAPKRNMLPKAPRHRRFPCGRKAHSRLPPPACAGSLRASMTRCSAASRGKRRWRTKSGADRHGSNSAPRRAGSP